MNFPVSIKGVLVEAGRVVLLEKNATNGNYPVVASNPAKPQRPVSLVNSRKNWVRWRKPLALSTVGSTRCCLNARSSSSPTV